MQKVDGPWLRALAEAEAWSRCEADGTMTSADYAVFLAWLQEAPDHVAAYAQVAPRQGTWPGLMLGAQGDDRLKGVE